jgi:hypothetical protein
MAAALNGASVLSLSLSMPRVWGIQRAALWKNRKWKIGN